MNTSFDQAFSPLLNEPQSGLHYRVRCVAASGVNATRLFLLHGVGGNETNLAALAATIDERVQVILVRGPHTLGPGQFAWFNVQFTAEGPVIDAQQAEGSRQALLTLISALNTDNPLPRSVIAGFSQGGILSASVGLSAPSDVNGFATLSGRILPELAPHIAPAAELASLQAFIAHGTSDNKLPVIWAERADLLLSKLGVSSRSRRYAIGHEIDSQVASDFNDWLALPLGLD